MSVVSVCLIQALCPWKQGFFTGRMSSKERRQGHRGGGKAGQQNSGGNAAVDKMKGSAEQSGRNRPDQESVAMRNYEERLLRAAERRRERKMERMRERKKKRKERAALISKRAREKAERKGSEPERQVVGEGT